MKSGIVWADCEMTGLSIDNDALIEIAVLVTDDELNILGDGVDLVIHADNHILATMNDVVKNMHDSSGLTAEVQSSTITIEQAQDRIMEYIKQYVRPKSAPLAGNSIATDRAFIARDLPLFHDYLHYRMIDVSSIKELTRRWYPEVYNYQPAKGLAHRALADIKESIAELQYYRKAVFVPPPGYNQEKLVEIRDEVQKLSSAGQ